MHRYDAATLREQTETILRAWDMPADLATRTAEIMIDADLRGIDSHGISMLPTYEAKRNVGGLRLDARAEIVPSPGAAVALLDAHHGLGHVPAVDAMDIACGLAEEFGIGLATVRNSHHFGAAGYYVRRAANRGLLAMTVTSSHTLTQAPTGGTQRRLGTNPIAFAAPGERHPPFVLDMSTTIVAVNKVKSYALANLDLPAPWVIDQHGDQVQDSSQALNLLRNSDRGGLLPLGGVGTLAGGHKGYGLSMMVQILSCALSGAAQPGDGPPDNIGHTFLAIEPDAFGTAKGTARHYIDTLTDTMRATTPTEPSQPVQVAGEPEDRALTERAARGVPMTDTLYSQIRSLCQRAAAQFHLDE
jgi:LDH2 family malate/lactate/ureidoglycolate dehydrogenase